MPKKKTGKKLALKKLGKVKPYPVIESIVPVKDTLFPEELKQANEFLEQIKDCEFLKSHR